MTLSEVNPRFIQQADPGLQKRWFADEEIDLTVWQEEDGRVVHFQFVLQGQDLVEWDENRGLRTGILHGQADSAGSPKGSRTYVLKTASDPALLATAMSEFARQGSELEPKLKAFVEDALSGRLDSPHPGKIVKLRALKPPPPEVRPVRLESRTVSLGMMTPRRMRDLLASLAATGWELATVGGNVAIFQRESDVQSVDISYDVRPITLKMPHQIRSMLAARGHQGECLAGIGSNFAFFKRTRNCPPDPREYRMDWIWLYSPAKLQRKVDGLLQDGWRLTGMGRQFAVFERPLDPAAHRAWQHKTVSCPMFATVTGALDCVEQIVDREAKEGWRPCALRAGRLYLRRPAKP